MSFFKEFREDFSQAVNEFLPDNDYPVDGFSDAEQKMQDDLAQQMKEALDNIDAAVVVEEEEMFALGHVLEDGAGEGEQLEGQRHSKMHDIEKNNVVRLTQVKEAEQNIRQDAAVSVISQGTKVEGSLTSDGGVEVYGTVTGDVLCLGELTIVGEISGNCTASDIYVNTARLEGNLTSEGVVKVGVGTVVIGDIKATSGVFAGVIKGEIDVNGPVLVDSTAIVKGNIKAKSIQINNGAVVDGYCSLAYASIDIDDFFETEEKDAEAEIKGIEEKETEEIEEAETEEMETEGTEETETEETETEEAETVETEPEEAETEEAKAESTETDAKAAEVKQPETKRQKQKNRSEKNKSKRQHG